jgi:hypothetical protein
MVYLPAIIVLLALLAVVVTVIARGGSSLWRWLFALEILVLFECFGNCFVPGSWHQFWQIEIPATLIAVTLATVSSILRIRKELATQRYSKFKIGTTPQMLALYGVISVVSIVVISH